MYPVARVVITMKLTPLYPKIIVERIPIEDTKSGIILPDAVKQESLRGIVVETFEGCPLEVGWTIVYARFAGDPIPYNEKDCLIMDYNQENVLAIETYE